MRILRVGDPHIRPNNIEESNKLMAFVISEAIKNKVDSIEILGDLFHTHAVIRLEVLEFWQYWFRQLSQFPVFVLVGNHDMDGDYGSKSHALSVFKKEQGESPEIIDKAQQIGIFAYMPYYHDAEDFKRDAAKLASQGAKTLICHQTFAGSQYDNGFYAPNGINPDDIPFETIISGHIHKEQIIAGGKVDYPGTAKWDTVSDANERKGIWIYDHDDTTGKVLKREMISTNNVVTPIVSITWNEGSPEPVLMSGAKTNIELVGSSDWISKKKDLLKGKASISSKITDKERPANRKSTNTFDNFLLNVYHTEMDRNDLLTYAKEIGVV